MANLSFIKKDAAVFGHDCRNFRAWCRSLHLGCLGNSRTSNLGKPIASTPDAIAEAFTEALGDPAQHAAVFAGRASLSAGHAADGLCPRDGPRNHRRERPRFRPPDAGANQVTPTMLAGAGASPTGQFSSTPAEPTRDARASHFAFSMTASTLPSRIARFSMAWSFSFWSAYAIEKVATALSKESLLPRYPLIIAASPERAWESASE